MKKKKAQLKRISLFLIVTLLLTLSVGTTFASDDKAIPSKVETLSVSSIPYAKDITALAEKYLIDNKVNLSSNPEVYGFSALELKSLELGTPFTIFVFDENGNTVCEDVVCYPLIYLDNIVGTMEMTFNEKTSEYNVTFGKSYGDELNKILDNENLMKGDVIVGSVDNFLFATNRSDVAIIKEYPKELVATKTTIDVKSVCSKITLPKNVQYNNVKVITNTQQAGSSLAPVSVPYTTKSSPNPLPVPHVGQTGTCGEAAWASVLNYRFDVNFSNATLHNIMDANGYINGTSGVPTMGDYRDFANDNYYAGCITSSSLSYANLESAIDNGKPIMGAWWSYKDAGKSWHAILITGYRAMPTTYTYTVKNPWHTYSQTVTVYNCNSVVYTDGPYVWNLSSVVY